MEKKNSGRTTLAEIFVKYFLNKEGVLPESFFQNKNK